MTPAPATVLTGPALRYVDDRTATVWLEASAPATVRVRAASSAGTALVSSARTFAVRGHHFALVVLDGLTPGSELSYSVELDGAPVWPAAGDDRPAPRIRPHDTGRDVDVVFGSCRIDRPDAEPWSLAHGSHLHAAGIDALATLSRAIQAGERPLPDLLVLLGDQIYADYRLSPESAPGELVPAAPGVLLPGGEAITFEEYAAVYRSAWAQPDIRWLLATVPSAMIFDDHEVRNNWNVSASWQREALTSPGWADQIRSAYAAYWLYQHAGNLSPDALRDEGVWPALTRADPDAGNCDEALWSFVTRADEAAAENRASPWSYDRQLASSRLVVLDTRSSRVLDESRRSMFTGGEWDRVDSLLRGDCDHLLVATSVPLLLHHAQQDAEAWNEAVCRGVFGQRAARWAESLRRHANLDQWGAFQSSLNRLVGILGDVAAGRRGAAPRTVLVLSGDVHHAYVAHLAFPRSVGARAPVVQMVCSPFRNQLPLVVRRGLALAGWRPVRILTRLLARSAGVRRAPFRWTIPTGPMFGNFVASLRLTRDGASLRIDEAVAPATGADRPVLRSRSERTVPGLSRERARAAAAS
ncbi:alkaline phosphatase D family protein [Planctomonas psychrotolerans]|uniref:alkaline phosphatase D family protein n=1 Tax=Planctomonas psychrotolerans TaxID=2528712 RepID=UPI00123A7478|nr:alkaline phosphatase D family protein [Planctomonas psychrotolerans]